MDSDELFPIRDQSPEPLDQVGPGELAAPNDADTAYDGVSAEGDSPDIDDNLPSESWGHEPTVEKIGNTALAETRIPDNTIALPENFNELIDEDLQPIPGHIGYGVDTQMFHVNGRPDLRVRLNEGYLVDEMTEAKEACDQLVPHGVHVLPSTIVEHNGQAYVVTKEVDGTNLDDILGTETPDEVLAQVDLTWAGLSKACADAKRTERNIPGDTTDTFQYMYGTVARDDTPKVWLVDLPKSCSPANEEDTLGVELLDITGTVIDIERTTGRTLTAARAAIREAATLCESSEQYGNALPNAVRFMLDHSVRIYNGDDEQILPLRTDNI